MQRKWESYTPIGQHTFPPYAKGRESYISQMVPSQNRSIPRQQHTLDLDVYSICQPHDGLDAMSQAPRTQEYMSPDWQRSFDLTRVLHIPSNDDHK